MSDEKKVCEVCHKIQHASAAKAKRVAKATKSNNLNDNRVYNAFKCKKLGCNVWVVGTEDRFSIRGSKHLRRMKNERDYPDE